MIGPLLWLNYLLTYVSTERALLGSRRRFDVNDLVYAWVSATKIDYWWKICTFLKVIKH